MCLAQASISSCSIGSLIMASTPTKASNSSASCRVGTRVKVMLISNYTEAQQQAIAAGALAGFGKREIGTKRVTELLRGAARISIPIFNSTNRMV